IRVDGADGTSGAYGMQVILNAAVEDEGHNGSANNSRATAQNLDGSFISLGSGIQRGAVLGTAQGTNFYALTLAAGQIASLAVKATTGSTLGLALQNSAGAVLAFGSANAANSDWRIDNVVAPSAGVYYAVISDSTANNYNLTVTRGADFDRESN